MIIARVHHIPVEIEDAVNNCALVRTLDGSRPFTARVARTDPEEIPVCEFIKTDWAWVAKDQLTEVAQTPCAWAEQNHKFPVAAFVDKATECKG